MIVKQEYNQDPYLCTSLREELAGTSFYAHCPRPEALELPQSREAKVSLACASDLGTICRRQPCMALWVWEFLWFPSAQIAIANNFTHEHYTKFVGSSCHQFSSSYYGVYHPLMISSESFILINRGIEAAKRF